MGVDAKHPFWTAKKEDWDQMSDTYEGERTVKDAGTQYLPMTSSMEDEGGNTNKSNTPGRKAYQAYKKRAQFDDIVRMAVEAMLGVMHNKPAVIEVPAIMEPLIQNATLKNESLQMLLQRINEEQLVFGRCGLLADLPVAPTPTQDGEVITSGANQREGELPYLALYSARNVINWDEGRRDGVQIENLNLVVLDESENERKEDFSWQLVEKYRVLILGEEAVNETKGSNVTYNAGVYRKDGDGSLDFNEEVQVTPMRMGQSIDFIPFWFVNTRDIVADPDQPPLLGLSNLALHIYRGEADFRQNLFAQGQDTFVTIGANFEPGQDVRIGAGARMDLPAGANAMMVGVDGSGLAEQASALDKDRDRAAQKGVQLLDSVSRERESGDSLKIRVAARTATLNTIAKVGAFALEQALRGIARWVGADENQVKVEPNLDFVDSDFTFEELVKAMTAKMSGAPISLKSIHGQLKGKDITDLEFEDEMKQIMDEDEEFGAPEGSTSEDGQVDGNEDDDDEEGRNPGTGEAEDGGPQGR